MARIASGFLARSRPGARPGRADPQARIRGDAPGVRSHEEAVRGAHARTGRTDPDTGVDAGARGSWRSQLPARPAAVVGARPRSSQLAARAAVVRADPVGPRQR